jgi:hypothetical protein
MNRKLSLLFADLFLVSSIMGLRQTIEITAENTIPSTQINVKKI